MTDPARVSAASAGEPFDVLIVGAGVVGTAIARALSRMRRRGSGLALRICLVDEAEDVGARTSKANTAILHTGFDATPGTLESGLVRRGYDLLGAYAAAADIAVERTGAILLAWDDVQLAALPALREKAEKNGYRDTRPIASERCYELEPNLAPGALGGVLVPGEWIIDPWSPPLAFAFEAIANGVEFRPRTSVVSVQRGNGLWHVGLRAADADTADADTAGPAADRGGSIAAHLVVNAAGLGSDIVHALFGGDRSFEVTPRRGQLIVFDKAARRLIDHILLPVPTAMGKGVLVSPTVFGNVMLGPTAENLADRADTAVTRAGIEGLLEKGRRILPDLVEEEVTSTYAGMRAATQYDDFQFFRDGSYVCVGGIRSTGLTASMAIAEAVVGMVDDAGPVLVPRADGELAPPGNGGLVRLGERQLRSFFDDSLVERSPSAGRVVCHCESVTEHDLLRAMQTVLPPCSIDGVRRRTRALTGRCQGFSCLAAVCDRTGILPGA